MAQEDAMIHPGSHPTAAMGLARYRMQEDHARAAAYGAAREARRAARDAKLVDEARHPSRLGTLLHALSPRLSH